MQPTPQQAAQSMLQELRESRELLPYLTDDQRHQRALFECLMRANRLRPLPSCFGELA